MGLVELIKLGVTLNGVLSGYKTYIAGAGLIMVGLGTMITQGVTPFMDGSIDFSALMGIVRVQSVYVLEGFGLAAMRKGIETNGK